MKTVPLLVSPLIAVAVLLPKAASAEKLGQHPAIIAARVYAAQGYDYASKFYPHPAKLYLLSRPPADTPDESAADGRAAPVAPAPDGKALIALRRGEAVHSNKSQR